MDVLENLGAAVEEDGVGGDDVAQVLGDVTDELVVEGAVGTVGWGFVVDGAGGEEKGLEVCAACDCGKDRCMPRAGGGGIPGREMDVAVEF